MPILMKIGEKLSDIQGREDGWGDALKIANSHMYTGNNKGDYP